MRKPKARKDARPPPAWTEAEHAWAAWAERASIEARHARALAALEECENPHVKQYQFAQRDQRYIAKIARAKQALADAMQRAGMAQEILILTAESLITELVERDPYVLRDAAREAGTRKKRATKWPLLDAYLDTSLAENPEATAAQLWEKFDPHGGGDDDLYRDGDRLVEQYEESGRPRGSLSFAGFQRRVTLSKNRRK